MAKKPNVKIGNFKGNLSVDVKGLKERFKKWQTTLKGLSGEAIGVSRSKDNLYTFLKKHGVAKRIVFDKSGAKESGKIGKNVGGAQLIPLVEDLFLQGNYSPKATDAILQIQGLMEDYGRPESKLNPRNIRFNGIDSVDDEPMTVRGKVVKDKEGLPVYEIERVPIFGHYRTEEYVNYRNTFKDKDEFDAEDSDWYSETPGTAKPPMWQALYAKGKDAKLVDESLITIVDDMVKALDGAKFEITKDTPLPIENKGAAEKIYNEIDEVREWFDKAVNNPRYRTKSGKFSTDAASRFWRNTPIQLLDDDESDTIKEIIGVVAQKYPADIVEVPLKISRTQCKHIADLAGFKETPKEVKKMDWKNMLKGQEDKDDPRIQTFIERGTKTKDRLRMVGEKRKEKGKKNLRDYPYYPDEGRIARGYRTQELNPVESEILSSILTATYDTLQKRIASILAETKDGEEIDLTPLYDESMTMQNMFEKEKGYFHYPNAYEYKPTFLEEKEGMDYWSGKIRIPEDIRRKASNPTDYNIRWGKMIEVDGEPVGSLRDLIKTRFPRTMVKGESAGISATDRLQKNAELVISTGDRQIRGKPDIMKVQYKKPRMLSEPKYSDEVDKNERFWGIDNNAIIYVIRSPDYRKEKGEKIYPEVVRQDREKTLTPDEMPRRWDGSFGKSTDWKLIMRG